MARPSAIEWSLADLWDHMMDIVITPHDNPVEMEKFNEVTDNVEAEFKKLGIKRAWED